MNNNAKLFSLLNNFVENKNAFEHVKLLAEIIQSPDYISLQKAVAFQKPFAEYFSFEKLEALDNSELDNRKKLLHKLVSLHKQLIECINSGNGPKLTHEDTPNLISEKSISRLLQKISVSPNKSNYSNIRAEDTLAIFENSTIKSSQECFDRMPVSITKNKNVSEADITRIMGNTFYCIDISEFNEIHKKYLNMVDRSEKIIATEKTRKRKHTLFKIAVVLLCFGAVFVFRQFGYISDTYSIELIVLIFIAAIMYFIWG